MRKICFLEIQICLATRKNEFPCIAAKNVQLRFCVFLKFSLLLFGAEIEVCFSIFTVVIRHFKKEALFFVILEEFLKSHL